MDVVITGSRSVNQSEVTIEQLKSAYETTAKVVTIYGDAYLPIFERLHEELMVFQNKCDLKELAKRIAQ